MLIGPFFPVLKIPSNLKISTGGGRNVLAQLLPCCVGILFKGVLTTTEYSKIWFLYMQFKAILVLAGLFLFAHSPDPRTTFLVVVPANVNMGRVAGPPN